jgi:hypothetical protein
MGITKEPEAAIRALLGATLSRIFTVQNRTTKAPVNLTGWSPELAVFDKRGGTGLFVFNSSNGLTIPTPSNGQIVLSAFIPATGFALPVGVYWHRLRLTSGPTSVWPLFPGDFKVEAQ